MSEYLGVGRAHYGSGRRRAWRTPEVVTPAVGVALDLDTARWQLQVDSGIPDATITGAINRATAIVEANGDLSMLGRSLRIRLDLEDWISLDRTGDYRLISLPARPAERIVSVTMWDTSDTESTLRAADYSLLSPRPSSRPLLRVKSSAIENPRSVRCLAVEWVAGWPDAASIPRPLQELALLQLQVLHEQSGTVQWQRLRKLLATMLWSGFGDAEFESLVPSSGDGSTTTTPETPLQPITPIMPGTGTFYWWLQAGNTVGAIPAGANGIPYGDPQTFTVSAYAGLMYLVFSQLVANSDPRVITVDGFPQTGGFTKLANIVRAGEDYEVWRTNNALNGPVFGGSAIVVDR